MTPNEAYLILEKAATGRGMIMPKQMTLSGKSLNEMIPGARFDPKKNYHVFSQEKTIVEVPHA